VHAVDPFLRRPLGRGMRYFRLHGRPAYHYRYRYTDAELSALRDMLRTTRPNQVSSPARERSGCSSVRRTVSWDLMRRVSFASEAGAHGMARGLVLALAAAAAMAGCAHLRRRPAPPRAATIADRVAQYGPVARGRLLPFFAAAGVPYPPERFLLLGLKQERELQLYAAGAEQALRFVRSFAILGASGTLGPKLREGDHQVPEGVYAIDYLNPNSVAHLSLALSYPNQFDRVQAAEDGRDGGTLGGEIMIHGGSASIGCLAVGDRAAEDLFVLAADAGWHDAVVVVSPVDFRRATLPADYRPPVPWVTRLYAWLRTKLHTLPLPPTAAPIAAAR
jgi:hypothetical protein